MCPFFLALLFSAWTKTQLIEIKGHVLDPDGKPVAGAKVFVQPFVHCIPRLPARTAVSDAKGKFLVRSMRPQLDVGGVHHHAIAAMRDGFALALRMPEADPTLDIALKLSKDDHAIEGRIIDLEGRAAANVTVRAVVIHAQWTATVGTLTADLTAAVNTWQNRREPSDGNAIWFESIPIEEMGIRSEAVTDAAGRFRLAGMGAERIAELRLEGEHIVTERIHVMTRPGKRLEFGCATTRHYSTFSRGMLIHPMAFEYPVAPSAPVEGVVREQGTAKPVPGVELAVLGDGHVEPLKRVRSGADGRFRITGLPSRDLRLVHPRDKFDFFPNSVELPATRSRAPITVDFPVQRPVVIRGRVTDKLTGKPVSAMVYYESLPGNPNALRANEKVIDTATTAFAAGSFRLFVLPGPGVISVTAERRDGETHRYRVGDGVEQAKKRFPRAAAAIDEHAVTNLVLAIDPPLLGEVLDIGTVKLSRSDDTAKTDDK
jgi:hypothetical protein